MSEQSRQHAARMVVGLRWLVVILALIVLAFAIRIGEGSLDRMSESLCPPGWWHSGLGWAHCAYPPASILKYGAMYAGFAVIALLVIHMAAPGFKLLACRLLLFALMAPPAYQLLLVRFSWVEACKLFLVAVVALIFGFGARAVLKLPGKTDALKSK